MCLVVRKPVFKVFDLVPHKPGCAATEDGKRLTILYLGSSYVAKTKVLISFAVTICAFVFAYVKSWFSHNTAHMYMQYTTFLMSLLKYL